MASGRCLWMMSNEGTCHLVRKCGSFVIFFKLVLDKSEALWHRGITKVHLAVFHGKVLSGLYVKITLSKYFCQR